MNATRDKVDVMADSIARLYVGDVDGARAVINTEYPFDPNGRSPCKLPTPRNLPKLPSLDSSKTREPLLPQRILRIAVRDGFIDRYSGKKLIYRAAMRAMSALMPKEFPYYPHGDLDVTHIAWWELFPSLDHVTPIAHNGEDTDDNLVLCSMTNNDAKSNRTLDELGWQLHARGDMNEWDGLLKVATVLISQRSELQKISYIQPWHTAALKLFPTLLDANHEY